MHGKKARSNTPGRGKEVSKTKISTAISLPPQENVKAKHHSNGKKSSKSESISSTQAFCSS
jgi:hypothetical protein